MLPRKNQSAEAGQVVAGVAHMKEAGDQNKKRPNGPVLFPRPPTPIDGQSESSTLDVTAQILIIFSSLLQKSSRNHVLRNPRRIHPAELATHRTVDDWLKGWFVSTVRKNSLSGQFDRVVRMNSS